MRLKIEGYLRNINQTRQTCESRSLWWLLLLLLQASAPGGPQISDMTGDICFKTTFSSAAAAFWPLPLMGEGGGGGGGRQIPMVFLWAHDCCRDSQVKHMHLNPGCGCNLCHSQGRAAVATAERAPAAVPCVAWNHPYLTRENVFGCP